MQRRTLGRSDLKIAPLVFGGNVFGWTADEKTSFAMLDAFIDAGFNCIDTADVYTVWASCGGGKSESVIGDWMAQTGKREQVIIATKVGSPMSPGNKGLSAKHILESAEGSLRRLRTDYIDLYQAHVDDESAPQDETAEAFAKLIEQGKVRVIGASKLPIARVKSALQISKDKGLPRYETLQPLYNLYDRAPYEAELQKLCLDEEIGVIPFYGLASGFLTGKYRTEADFAKSAVRGGFVKEYLNPRGLRILAGLDAVGAKHDATPAQIALAWVMAQPGIAGSIASATSVAQLEELMKSVALTLSADDLATLDRASAA